jgi:hypothetical protein
MKDYARRYRRRKTRLTKLEEKRNFKQAFIFGLLSIILLFVFLIIGLPALIKLAIFIGEKKAATPIKEENGITLQAPVFDYLPEATNSAFLNLKGFAQEETKVEIILNGEKLKEVTPDEEGEFELKGITLQSGKNKIKARTIDKNDHQSDFSQEVVIVLDNQAPSLAISQPEDGDKFFDKEREIMLSGQTEKEATVYVNNRLALVDKEGGFSLNYELAEGDNQLKFTAFDLAGNKTEKEITVSYTP